MTLFALTPEEKRVVIFVVLMILFGVAVKEYRKQHRPATIVHKVDRTRETQALAAALRGSPAAAETPSASPHIKHARKARTPRAAAVSSPALTPTAVESPSG